MFNNIEIYDYKKLLRLQKSNNKNIFIVEKHINIILKLSIITNVLVNKEIKLK